MTGSEEREVENTCKKIVGAYYSDNDLSTMFQYFSDRVVFISSERKIRIEGAENIKSSLSNIASKLKKWSIKDFECSVVKLSEGLYQADCTFEVQPLESQESDPWLTRLISFTLTRELSGELRCIHIINSNVGTTDNDYSQENTKAIYNQLISRIQNQSTEIDLMLNSLNGGIVLSKSDPDLTACFISESLCKILGYEDKEDFYLQTKNKLSIICHPDDFKKIAKTFNEITEEDDGAFLIEARLKNRNGEYRYFSISAKKDQSDIYGPVFCAFVNDIDEAKKTQEEIKKAQVKQKKSLDALNTLYNQIPVGIIQFRPTAPYQIIKANPKFWKFHGFDSEENFLKAHPDILSVISSKDRDSFCQTVEKCKERDADIEITRESYSRDRKRVPFSCVIGKTEDIEGKPVIQMISTDISYVERLEHLEESERIIVNSSLITAMAKNYILTASINFTKSTYDCFIPSQPCPFKKRRGNLAEVNQEILSFFSPSCKEEVKAAFSPKSVIDGFSQSREIYHESQVKTKDGEKFISIRLIKVDDPLGNDRLALLLIKDLEEERRQKAEQEQLLRDALAAANAANEAKTDFLSKMSHDIRTPLNAIIGMSTIGQLDCRDQNKMADCFKKIDSSSRYLLSLINNILDMSKIESGKMVLTKQQFDLSELLHEVISIAYPQSEAAGLSFDVHSKEPLAKYYVGDSLRIKQILLNLLSNSIKFTPAKGHILLEVQEEKKEGSEAFVRFMVQDDGRGMSDDFQTRLFLPFEQEDPEKARNNVGSGLGLSIVKNLIQLMNGSLSVQSKIGQGSSFTCLVPLGLVDESKEEKKKRQVAELMKNSQILVADDSQVVGKQVGLILGEIGAQVTFVDSGKKAVKQVSKQAKINKYYDIAMIDWKMPDMDGVEVTRRIRKIVGPETTIIIISAYDWSDIESKARKAGADFFISKPFMKSSVYDALLSLNYSGHEKENIELPDVEPLKGKTFLIAEDNELNMEITSTLLANFGAKFLKTVNGQEAVDICKSPQGKDIAAILMDIRMPIMDGLEATKAIRALKDPVSASIPIIAMTANAFEEDKAKAYQAGMNAYLIKPIDMSELTRVLVDVVSHPQNYGRK